MKPHTTLGVGLLVAIVALGVLAVLSAGKGPEPYPPGTPEAAVQDFFQAVVDDQPDDALALVDPDLDCRDRSPPGYPNPSRVLLDEVSYTNAAENEASVRVRITESWGDDLFSSNESTFTDTLYLSVDDSGDWKIIEPAWPFFDCQRDG